MQAGTICKPWAYSDRSQTGHRQVEVDGPQAAAVKRYPCLLPQKAGAGSGSAGSFSAHQKIRPDGRLPVWTSRLVSLQLTLPCLLDRENRRTPEGSRGRVISKRQMMFECASVHAREDKCKC